MCHNFRSIKAMKENITYIYKPVASEVCAKCFGNVTREKQVRGKKKHLL